MAKLTVKRGDTLRIECTWTDESGNPVNITGMSIAAQLATKTTPTDLTVTIVDGPSGRFDLSLTATQTAAIAIDTYDIDVEFTDGAEVISTETFQVQFVKDITNAD